MRHRRHLLVTSLAAAGLVVSAVPAGAHPFITDGATALANSLATVTLAVAHGCGDEAGGEGDPTSDVSLEVPEAVSYLAPGEADGYEVTVEGDEGAVPDIVTWTATDGGVPAPELPLDIVVDGADGDELFLSVFQACGDVEYRWIGTPDEPADDPAIGLTLTAEDPDSPPPAAEAPAPADGAGAEDGGATDDTVADETDGAEGSEDTPDAVEALPTEPEEAGTEGSSALPWVVAGAIVLAGGGAFLGSRRKPGTDTGTDTGTGAGEGDPPRA